MRISDACLDQLFFKARTANGFMDKPVPAELLKEVYDIAKMGATSMNAQPTRYVFLTTPQARERLLPGQQPHCPALWPSPLQPPSCPTLTPWPTLQCWWRLQQGGQQQHCQWVNKHIL